MTVLEETRRRANEKLDRLPGVLPAQPLDVMQALAQWIVTDEQVEQMEETRLIWRDVVALSHLSVWSGPAGAGKTAIGRFARGELADRGYRVLYFQEDAPAGDLPAMHEHAKTHGYVLLNSTLSGSTPDAQLGVLYALASEGADLGSTVMIFDTLKKYVFLMSKDGARAFFSLMRSLTQRGATIILLAHTNKNFGVDGKPVFEGVGDVRNDCDELFYLDATDKDERGIRTMTLRPDKTRCAVTAATFTLDTTTMEVRALDRVVDVQEVERSKRMLEQDAEVIGAIDEALAGGGMNRTDLIDKAAKSSGHGAKSVRRVLDRYTSEEASDAQALWLLTRMRLNNVRHIARNPRRGSARQTA